MAIPRQRLQLVKDSSMVSKLNWTCVKLLSFAKINTSTLVNLDGIEMIQLNDGAVQVAKESDIADVMQRLPNYYKSLKAVKILDIIVQGQIAIHRFWLGCQRHCTKGRPRQFANGFCLNSIVSVVFDVALRLAL